MTPTEGLRTVANRLLRLASRVALVSLLLLSWAGTAQGLVRLRVALLRGASTFEVTSQEALRVYAIQQTRLMRELRGGEKLSFRWSRGKIFLNGEGLPVDTIRLKTLGAPIRLNGVPYRGGLDLLPDGDRGLVVVNEVELEDYLRGVVGREMPASWPPEALRAQAVAARTFALLLRARSTPRPYDLTAGTGDQVYSGIEAEHPSVDEAVQATAGLVLTFRGVLARTFFHASAAGHTEDVSVVWPGIDEPYLKGLRLPFDDAGPRHRWESVLSFQGLEDLLQRAGHEIRDVRQLKTRGKTPSGRVAQVVIQHQGGSLKLSAHRFRHLVGPSRIRSTFFRLEVGGRRIRFLGVGNGHGVGMSQWGAYQMAKEGKSFEEILAFFYPGTQPRRAEEGTMPTGPPLPKELEDLGTLLR